MVTAGVRSDVEDVAFLNWKLHANEKAYAAKVITTPMYEYARKEIEKQMEKYAEVYRPGIST